MSDSLSSASGLGKTSKAVRTRSALKDKLKEVLYDSLIPPLIDIIHSYNSSSRFFLMGGTGQTPSNAFATLSSVLCYDPSSDRWEEEGITHPVGGVVQAASCVVDDRVLVMAGGYDKSGDLEFSYALDLWAEPSSQIWIPLPPIGEVLAGHHLFAAGPRVFLVSNDREYSAKRNFRYLDLVIPPLASTDKSKITTVQSKWMPCALDGTAESALQSQNPALATALLPFTESSSGLKSLWTGPERRGIVHALFVVGGRLSGGGNQPKLACPAFALPTPYENAITGADGSLSSASGSIRYLNPFANDIFLTDEERAKANAKQTVVPPLHIESPVHPTLFSQLAAPKRACVAGGALVWTPKAIGGAAAALNVPKLLSSPFDLCRQLILIGGYDNHQTRKPQKVVYRLPLPCLKPTPKESEQLYTWREFAALNDARHSFGCAVLGGDMYVFGGFDDDRMPLTTVECYDEATSKWLRKSPMPQSRAHFAYFPVDPP